MDKDIGLMAFVDGELSAEEAREVEALIASDPNSRQLVEQFEQTTNLLRAACAENFYANPTMRLPPPRRTFASALRRYMSVATVALVALFFGISGAAFVISRPISQRDHLIDEIAEYHSVQSKETKHLVEVPSAEADDLKTWFGRRLERHLEVPDLSASGLQFAGGRMLVVAWKPVAEFMYTRASGPPVALCIAHTGAEPAGVRVDHRDDLHLASWQEGGYTYVIVGDLSPDEAEALAERARSQLNT
jgi:anti-sigma factor RsiW